ncbi:MAG: diguanylate cyclase [Breoghania sp.]|nr:diguanylate cyclase [Breoghania sp.]MDJ0932037.1 diguanylate cyclase [Breoghania sp.]
MRRVVETISAPSRGGGTGQEDFIRVTVSVGVAEYRAGENADDLYLRADNCLYRAKAEGRNRVEGDCDADLWGGGPLDLSE